MVFIYFIASMFRRSPQPQETKTVDGQPIPVARPSSNVFEKFTHMDMYVYVSEQEEFTDFKNEKALFWLERGLVYGDWTGGVNNDGSFETTGTIDASESVQNNGSLYIHVFFVKEGMSPDPSDQPIENLFKKYTAHKSKKRKIFIIICRYFHLHPNLTINNLLGDHSPWVLGSVPSPLDEILSFYLMLQVLPCDLLLNDYWNLNVDYMPINDTTRSLNLTLTFSSMSLFKWQLQCHQGMRNKWVNTLGSDGRVRTSEDQDSSQDIQFWKSRKSLEGLSVRSVFFNVIQSLIVLLYIMDNETNTVVKISVFVGLCIEIWKINKVVNAQLDKENKIFGIIPRLKLIEKSTYTESHTKEYDLMAFRYLSWLLYPLLGGYAVYSLVYQEHKGWYSWVLNMLYGFLLTFGFIMMTPQLFINYKLKSVAHLPWRMLTYKALNTFIDDIFAFVIKMPTLYRLGCLRDDVIFFIYLYQRYIYSVDPKRVNEFGTSQEMLESNGQAVTGGEGGAQMSITEGENTSQENGSVIKSEEEKKNE
ncbi:Cleft lip and palate transmembrane protein 1 like protein [Bulinus truncatus]|nr:Cleft lip and palate transmembrane protein 1 like protein [Bulinus truncatus]